MSAEGEQPSFTLEEKSESIEIDSESVLSGRTFRRLSQPALNRLNPNFGFKRSKQLASKLYN